MNSLDMASVDDRLYVASGGEDGQVAVFDAQLGDESLNYLSPAGDPVSVVQFAELDGRLVLLAAEAGQAGTIRKWRIDHGESFLPPLIGELEAGVVQFDVSAGTTGRPVVALAFADDSVVLRHVDGEPLAGPLASELMLIGVHVRRSGTGHYWSPTDARPTQRRAWSGCGSCAPRPMWRCTTSDSQT